VKRLSSISFLLIAVAIIGATTAIGIPTYKDASTAPPDLNNIHVASTLPPDPNWIAIPNSWS
jgi:hypothetical protein